MADHNEAMRLIDLFELEPDPESLYRQAAAELRNLLAANLYMKDLTDQALDDVRALTAERDQLREEVGRLRAESVPLGAIRGIAIEAIRDVIGCPDVSNDGKHLSDTMEETARHATYAAIAARTTHKETE